MFKLFFSFSGRINRKVFIWSWLFLTLIQMGVSYLIVENPISSFLVMLPVMHFMAVLAIKRFHDLNKSGWFYLCLWIPLVGLYFYALLIFKKGTTGNNTYGPDLLVKKQKREDAPSEPVSKPVEKQYPVKSHGDVISNSAYSNSVDSTSSWGFGKKLVFGLGVLLVTGAIISYLENSDSSHQGLEKELSKKSSDFNRGLSSSTTENSELEEKVNNQVSKFIFQVLNINNDEVTVQFERDIPMNIKFFGVSKDLVRRAEILSREDQRQAVIFLNSASLLHVGKRYYGYLVNSSEESVPPSEDWL